MTRFSPGTPVSSTNKTDPHDTTEILLKVELNTLTPCMVSYWFTNFVCKCLIDIRYFVIFPVGGVACRVGSEWKKNSLYICQVALKMAKWYHVRIVTFGVLLEKNLKCLMTAILMDVR